MRIVLNHTYYDSVGGAERYLHRLTGSLLEEGHEVHYVCGRRNQPDPRIHFHHVPLVRFPRWARPLFFSILSSSVVRNLGADVVHGFGRTIEQDIYSEGSGLDAPLRTPFGALSAYRLVTRCLERKRFTNPRLKTVLCRSVRVQAQLTTRYPSLDGRLQLLYNGVDCQLFNPWNRERFRAAVRTELAIGAGDLVFILVGNDFQRKNVKTALRALARLSNRRAWLVVVGRDRHAQRYRRLAARLGLIERVRFTGLRPDVHRYLGAADVFLLPTLYDVFPNAVPEAMASGLPVIVSRLAGTAEILEDRREGALLNDPHSAGELGRYMEEFGSRVRRDQCGKAARATAESLSWDQHYRSLFSSYLEMAQR